MPYGLERAEIAYDRKRLADHTILYDLQALIYFRGNLTVKVAPPPAVSLIMIIPFSI